MTQSPLQPVHVFPYCHKVSGGHSNAIRAMVLAEVSQGLDSLMFCPFCDDPSLEKLRHGIIVARRHGPAGDPSDEPVVEAPLGAPRQIFHVHGVNWDVVRVARCLRRKTVPYVMTSHGALNYRGPLHFLKKFIVLNLFTGLVGKAKGIHFLNEVGRHRFQRLMPTWSGATLVAAHAVQVPDLSQLTVASRTDFGVPPDGFLFLYLGRLDVHTKGLDLLVQAFSQVAAGGTARLILAGPDWEGGRAQLEALARRLGCTDRVHFLGPQYGAKKWAALRLADVFVSPSRWDAGPVTLKEAIGVGLPAITTTVINPAQELAEHHAVYLCAPTVSGVARAMNTLMGDAALRQQLGADGQAYVLHNCSRPVVGQALAGFYERALASHR
jgi:glycosyltransferase involved in cell wall biosynthesis